MALRLIFEAQGDNLRLIRQTRVDMEAPGSPSDNPLPTRGIYAEVRDALDRTLYQASLSSQVDSALEVFSPDGAIERVDAPANRKIVVLVAPELPEAKALVVVRRGESHVSMPGRGGVRSESGNDQEQELIRVDLTANR